MGRDKPKKFSKMGYFEQEEYKNEKAKKYGIQGTEYRDSRGNTQTRRNDKALKAAMRNDFDYRTSAQHMDGVKGNAKFGDFTEYERKAVKLHKQAGNGGEYSSNKDITGVTNKLVKDYRKGLTDAMSPQEQQSKAEQEPYEESFELADARKTVEDFDNTDFNIYNDASSSDGNDQRNQAANSFLDNFKLDLKSKMKPKLPV